jgi:hypothetical protein
MSLLKVNSVTDLGGDAPTIPPYPGQILQVISTIKTDTFTMSSTTRETLPGLTATITPSSTSSKVLVMVATNGSTSNSVVTNMLYRLMRNATEIAVGDSAGTRKRVTFSGTSMVEGMRDQMRSVAMTFLDSPATTSAITYSVDISATQNQTIAVNRAFSDNDSNVNGRGVSTITVMEVAG